jgi:hypothetical protein
MNRQFGGMSFISDLVSEFPIFRHYKPIFELQHTLLIYPEVLGLFFFHLSIDVEYTHIGFLKLNDLAF